eukprot:CAMPEP_0182512052 /NCGR_PEP_ID=MMETSP1321-20130603/31518_1 /TAXON_ID=91990 /ORGANISM="Bolidomonas sp., Strain RCC1657" /LENGTH=59 /DNA_ID=CAMNT_0024718801 /DNA_START=277 /DNA_END=453 /DNA_ORIENTATION=+
MTAPVFSAILNAPLLNACSLPSLLLVPSGNVHRLTPSLSHLRPSLYVLTWLFLLERSTV